MTALDGATKPTGCVSWRATQQCSPFGIREPSADVSCRAFVRFTSGYCECENSRIVGLVACGMHTFTCFDRCRELGAEAMRLPELMTCHAQPAAGTAAAGTPRPELHVQHRALASGGSGAAPGQQSAGSTPGAQSIPPNASAGSLPVRDSADHPLDAGSGGGGQQGSLEHSQELWEALVGPVRVHGPGTVQPLTKRTEDEDWLREGGRMDPGLVSSLKSSLRRYIAQVTHPMPGAPDALPASASGRGIVMVSGGLRFMVSAWIGLALLRRSGSTLPVEMWFPVLEYPTAALVEHLRAQGVTCRAFAVADLDQQGYQLKVAAIMLSSFAEVLFLDADNFVLRDPAHLFESEEYKRTGSLFWRDYWDATAVPGLHTILGLPRSDLPKCTFEAGQMVIDKRKHWTGLRVALYFNYHNEIYYNLFTDYMGWGDKETFYYAFLAAREAVHYVPHPTGSVGLVRPFCRSYKTRQLCRDVFTGNSMVQYGLEGRPLFLHANLDKWSLRLPDDYAHYTRRWQVLQPGGEAFGEWSAREMGTDLERFAYDQVRAFRCAPFFEEYLAVRLRHGDRPTEPLGGLHPLMPGIEFHQMYRLGHAGSYTALFQRSLLDGALHALGTASRRQLRVLKRGLRYVYGGKRVCRLLFKLERGIRRVLLSYAM